VPADLRTLIVDDSAVYRSLIRSCLERMPRVTFVGTAIHGKDAIERARELQPDLILLDIEMPVMDGLEAIPGLRRVVPNAAIIMVSSLTTDGAQATLQALEAGAFDFVAKPRMRAGEDGFAVLASALEHVIEGYRESRRRPETRPTRPARPQALHTKVPRVDLVAIGVSTGGPAALGQMIPALEADFPLPVAIVQHMPPRFTRSLAETLDSKSRLHVLEAEDGRPLQRGEVVIAPGDRHLRIACRESEPFVQLTQEPPVNAFRPAVDVLFRSAAEAFEGRVLAVVLTGMGSDGTAGAQEIVGRGGYCIVQDAASCTVYGMPRAAFEAGAADEVVPLVAMPGRIRSIAAGR
jgi:two-component system chemotaxis response regulator CheB